MGRVNRHCGCIKSGNMIYCEEARVLVPVYSSCLRGTRFNERVKFKKLLSQLEEERDDPKDRRKINGCVFRNADQNKERDI